MNTEYIDMQVKEIEAKSILVKSHLPDSDYVVNPYVGCQFGCLYCYASFMGRFVGESVEAWGDYLYAKKNAVELFANELSSLRKRGKTPSIFLSSVTDPYQGPEKRYRLTRGILEILAREPYPGMVGILTKSPLVLRDIDLLKQLPNAEIGLTITTTDDKVSRFLEVRAPTATHRLVTLKRLNTEGLKTYAFIGPLLPHFQLNYTDMEALVAAVAATGVLSVYVEHINLKPYIRRRLMPEVSACSTNIQSVYQSAKFDDYRQKTNAILEPLLAKYGLHLRMDKILHHETDMKK